MTREEVKELLPVIKALAEGKTIQDKIEGVTDWVDTDEINLEYNGQKIIHRIKPESEYRPFKSKEECWDEMHNHPDIGWVISKNCKTIYQIDSISNNLIIDYAIYSFDDMYQKYEFLDGTPFGIKEE